MKEKLINGLKWFYKSYIWLFIVLLVMDIITKQIILHSPVDAEGHIAKWGIVNISYVLNENAAFGIGAGNALASRIIYLVIATLVSIGISVYLVLKRKEMKIYIRACLILIITGAIGNMIDRIFYGPLQYPDAKGLFTGSVVDWIDFYWFWPFVFNIADCCIVIAAFMLLIYFIVIEVKEMKDKRKEEIASDTAKENNEESHEELQEINENKESE